MPFVTPGVEQSSEVPEGLEIELEPIVNLELAQTMGSTRYIPRDTEIGVWDPVHRIYTLTKDVNESIEITQNNLTLDGAGYKITGSESGNGVYLRQRSNVTVKNCVVFGFYNGICLLYDSEFNTLTNNITNDNSCGIYLNSGSSNTLTNNITNNNSYGIVLNYSSSNALTSNTPNNNYCCLLYTSPSPRDRQRSRMPSSA